MNIPVNGQLAEDLTSLESRKGMAVLLMNLFDRWNLTTEEKLNLLGLSVTSRALLGKYRDGKPFPVNRDALDRAGWLLAIHKALRLLYPENEELRYTWVKRRNRDFSYRRPIELMMDEGLIGIAKVSRYLDFQRGI